MRAASSVVAAVTRIPCTSRLACPRSSQRFSTRAVRSELPLLRLPSQRFSTRTARSELPLLRLPTVLFPSQPLSLRPTLDTAGLEAPAMTVPIELVDCAWREFDGKLAAVGPCGHAALSKLPSSWCQTFAPPAA